MKNFKHGLTKAERKQHKQARKERQNARGRGWMPPEENKEE